MSDHIEYIESPPNPFGAVWQFIERHPWIIYLLILAAEAPALAYIHKNGTNIFSIGLMTTPIRIIHTVGYLVWLMYLKRVHRTHNDAGAIATLGAWSERMAYFVISIFLPVFAHKLSKDELLRLTYIVLLLGLLDFFLDVSLAPSLFTS